VFLTNSCVGPSADAADNGGVTTPTLRSSAGETDDGFTLIELLIVIVILGILATVVIISVRGITDRGEDATCDGDAHTLANAAESYFAKYGGTTIPAAGAGNDAYEQTLADDGLLREPSDLYDLDTDGVIVLVPSSRCTAV
jgi:prepilin-type N-terminal cleavage/methylation domain-containing protein